MRNIGLYIVVLAVIVGSLYILKSGNNIDTDHQTQGKFRIVSVSPNITEILFALELDNSVAAVTDFCNYPAKAKKKPSIGTIMEPDIETILTLKPTDVFLTNTSFHLALGERLRSLGLKTEEFDVDRMDGIFATIERIGQITNQTDKSLSLNRKIADSLEQVRLASKKLSTRPRVLVVLQREPMIVAAANTYIGEILDIAGGENVITGAGKMFPTINAETLLTLAPEIIIETKVDAAQCFDPAVLAQYKWNLPAVSNNNVFVIDADIISRPGPRVVQAAEQMQQILFTWQQ